MMRHSLLISAACAAVLLFFRCLPGCAAPADSHPPIPIRFSLKEAGFVTLVIEDSTGKRMRNLVSDTPFPAGQNVVYWDGADESGGVKADAGGLFQTRGQLVSAGRYRVRGLFHKGLDPRYEFSVYTEGKPAWRTPDGTGRWLADHTPPVDVLYLPGENPRLLISSYVAEGGDSMVWTDLEGRKLAGIRWVGGQWTGALHLARDAGPQAVPGVEAYALSSWPVDKTATKISVRLSTLTGTKDTLLRQIELDPATATFKGDLPVGQRRAAEKRYVGGLAAHNGLVAINLIRHGQLVFLSAKDGKTLATATLPDARGLAFDKQGRLLALVGRVLRRYDLSKLDLSGDKTVTLPAPEVLVSNLENPDRIFMAESGEIYISDWGKSHQVKIFSAAGKPVRNIGKPGGAQLGAYDTSRMSHPSGMALLPDGRLWVAEESYSPKRVSVWSREGNFARAFYGPPQYGGGGHLSSDKAAFFYYDNAGMQFALDWNAGTWKLANIYHLPDEDKSGLVEFSNPSRGTNDGPQMPIDLNGRRYLTNVFNAGATDMADIAGVWLLKNGVAVPTAAVGEATGWPKLREPQFEARWPAGEYALLKKYYPGRSPDLFAWSDANGDALVQPEEVTIQKLPNKHNSKTNGVYRIGHVYLAPDLSITTTFGFQLKPRGFSTAGAPLYNAQDAASPFQEAQNLSFASGHDVIASGDWTVVTGNPVKGFQNGALKWTYPNQWPSLHEGHDAPAQQYPGQLIGTTKIIGPPVTPPGSDAGPLWAYNGDAGQIYLFTTDGLFVSQLFLTGHKIKARQWESLPATRNTSLVGIAQPGENFFPTIQQTSDGKVYLVTGKEHSSLVRVDGLETIQRLPAMNIEVTPALLAQAAEYSARRQAEQDQPPQAKNLAVAVRQTPPVMDGKLDDWAGAQWAQIDEKTQASIVVDKTNLYAAFRTGEADLLNNSGESIPSLFKTGGALDLMRGVDPKANRTQSTPREGDLRLLVTRVGTQTKAALYRPVSGAARKAGTEPVVFASPWRSVNFDSVEDVSTLVRLAAQGGNYEFSIPLSALGLKPATGLEIRGDIGVLRGEKGNTLQRQYWSNQATGLVNDVPGEALLEPARWGHLRFEAAPNP
jgi:hypothetical protein